MAKNLFTLTKEQSKVGLNPTVYTPSYMDVGGDANFSKESNSIIPPSAAQGKTTLWTPDPTKDDGGSIDYLASLLTTPEQESKYRKDSINAQKIGLLGDALRQIGNVITTSKGAVPQKFGASPVVGLAAEYKSDKAKRDADNLRYYSAKQQENIRKAQQDLAKQQMQYNILKDQQNWNYKLAKDKADAARWAIGEQNKKAEAEADRKWRSEENEKNRKNTLNAAYIRKANSDSADGGSKGYPFNTPYGKGLKAKDFTSSQINQMYGYAKRNNLINMSELKASMVALGLEEDSYEVKRQAVMDLLSTNQPFADYVIDTYDLSVGDREIEVDFGF